MISATMATIDANDIDSSMSSRATQYTSCDDDTATITDHPLLDDLLGPGGVEDKALALATRTGRSATGKAASNKKSPPLSSLAFKKKQPSSLLSRRRISWQEENVSTTSSNARRRGLVDAHPPRRRHSDYDCSRTKKDAASIPEADQIIIQLKLELAEAKSEVECQAAQIERLTKENERLTQSVKKHEVDSELHRVTSNSLEDATLEIQELLEENQRLVSQVDTVTYQRNELKNKLGMTTVSKPLIKGHHMSSDSTLETLEESISSNIFTDRRDISRRGSTIKHVGDGPDHRASALALMSSFRTSIRRIASSDGPEQQQVSVNELLWDDDADDELQQRQFAAQKA